MMSQTAHVIPDNFLSFIWKLIYPRLSTILYSVLIYCTSLTNPFLFDAFTVPSLML